MLQNFSSQGQNKGSEKTLKKHREVSSSFIQGADVSLPRFSL